MPWTPSVAGATAKPARDLDTLRTQVGRIFAEAPAPRGGGEAAAEPRKPTMEKPSRAIGRHQRSLEMLRVQVCQSFSEAPVLRSSSDVVRENERLALELSRAERALEDRGSVDAQWREEADLWRSEASGLRQHVEEQQEKLAKVAREAKARTARAAEGRSALLAELRREELALSEAHRRSAELHQEQVRCESMANEELRCTALLQRSLEQQAALGPAGGTAHLFVSALPALDASSADWALQAVEAQLQHLRSANGRR